MSTILILTGWWSLSYDTQHTLIVAGVNLFVWIIRHIVIRWEEDRSKKDSKGKKSKGKGRGASS